MPEPSSASGSETSSEDGWVDAEQEAEEEPAIISLLDDRVFSDGQAMISYCKETFGFDFLAIRDRLGLDFYGCVKLVNFVRQRVHEGVALPAEIQLADLEDERHLKPVLDDDAFIMCLDELPVPATPAVGSGGDGVVTESLLSRNAELQNELDLLVRQFADYRLAVQKTLDQRWGEGEGEGERSSSLSAPGESNPFESPSPPLQPEDDSRYYWESYAANEIHETMLKDRVRTEAYRDFIYNNKHFFKDKVVLDIGCGTGILSMFCAKAGAKLVIAVDKSDIIDKARANVFLNGLDGRVMCLKGRMEEVALPVEQVDVIVSEWMGYCLLFEAMLPSVLWARDRYLAPNGLVVPSHASLWLAPVTDPDYVADHVTFWRNVYGFDMRPMQEGIFVDPRIEVVPPAVLCGTPFMFRMLDLHTVRVEDLEFETEWRSDVNSPVDAATSTMLDGFLVWFDIFFAGSRGQQIEPADVTAQVWADESSSPGEDRVAFTTGPHGVPTHWKQGFLPIEIPQDDDKDSGRPPRLPLSAGQTVAGQVRFSVPHDNPRGLVVKVSWGSDKSMTQSWEVK